MYSPFLLWPNIHNVRSPHFNHVSVCALLLKTDVLCVLSSTKETSLCTCSHTNVAVVHLDKDRRKAAQAHEMVYGSEGQSGVSSCLKTALGSEVPSGFWALTRLVKGYCSRETGSGEER